MTDGKYRLAGRVFEDWQRAQADGRLFGFGRSKALKLVPLLEKRLGLWPAQLFDNDPALHGRTLDGFQILSPERISEIKDPKIIVFSGAYDSIKRQLTAHGLKEYADFIVCDDEIWPYVYLAAKRRLYMPTIHVAVTLKCTLNCQYCNMFVPACQNSGPIPLARLQEDLDLLFGPVGFVELLGLVGGEPLAYGHLADYLDYLGRHYRQRVGRVLIMTNGTVRPSARLLETCRRWQVDFSISDYSPSPDLPRQADKIKNLQALLDRHQISHNLSPLTWRIFFCPEDQALARLPRPELRRHYLNCRPVFKGLNDGNFYPCHLSWSAEKSGLLPCGPGDFLNLREIDPDDPAQLLLLQDSYLGAHEQGCPRLCRHCYGCDDQWRHDIETARQIGPDHQLPYGLEVSSGQMTGKPAQNQ